MHIYVTIGEVRGHGVSQCHLCENDSEPRFGIIIIATETHRRCCNSGLLFLWLVPAGICPCAFAGRAAFGRTTLSEGQGTPPAQARCGNVDTNFDHFSRISLAISPHTRRVICSASYPCVNWMPIAACNLMVCPIHGFMQALSPGSIAISAACRSTKRKNHGSGTPLPHSPDPHTPPAPRPCRVTPPLRRSRPPPAPHRNPGRPRKRNVIFR